MTAGAAECVAYKRGCGTPTGWRNGGRCGRCRQAHNRESRTARAMTPEQRARVLDLLRVGKTAEDAAADVGRSVRSLQTAAVRDSELRAALDGEPLNRQVIAHRGDLLFAMIRNGGNRAQAARDIGEKPVTIATWKSQDPLFDAAEKAVAAWVAQSEIGRRHKLSGALLDEAAALMESGMLPGKVADAIGVTDVTLRKYRAHHERLDAAWGMWNRAGVGSGRAKSGGKTSGLTPEVADRLRSQWEDRSLTAEEIASGFGVTLQTIRRWRKQLGLPTRNTRPRAGSRASRETLA